MAWYLANVETNEVLNIVEYDGVSVFNPPAGVKLVYHDDGYTFGDELPNLPKEPAAPKVVAPIVASTGVMPKIKGLFQHMSWNNSNKGN